MKLLILQYLGVFIYSNFTYSISQNVIVFFSCVQRASTNSCVTIHTIEKRILYSGIF